MCRQIELAIVAIVLILAAAILFPAMQILREDARRSACKNNLRQLCLGLSNYVDTFDGYPYATVGDPLKSPDHRWSWCAQMGPFLAQMAAPPIVYSSDSRDSKNWPLTFPMSKGQTTSMVTLHAPQWLTCPSGASDVGEFNQRLASYVGLTGIGPESATALSGNRHTGIWGYDRRTLRLDIASGLDKTILVVETAKERDVWLFGGHPTSRWVSPDSRLIGTDGAFGGFHPGIAMTGFADGHVTSLSENIDPKVFSSMATIGKSDVPKN